MANEVKSLVMNTLSIQQEQPSQGRRDSCSFYFGLFFEVDIN